MIKRNKIIICILLLVALSVAAVLLLPYIRRTQYPRQYNELVEKYSAEFDVPEPLIYAIIYNESDFDREAISNAGAKGLMQLMPDTFDWVAERLGETTSADNITDAETNIKYGTYYLSYLYNRFEDWKTVIAAYNAGPNKVADWLLDSRYSEDNKTLKSIPIEETKNYVNRVSQVQTQYEEIYYNGGN